MTQTQLFTKEWDYSQLASTYDQRADYNEEAINFIYRVSNLPREILVADIGAGTAKLAKLLLKQGSRVHAVEPNDVMKSVGIANTKGEAITWFRGNSHNTTLSDSAYDLATFGSSFNVADRNKALKEVRRILKPHGWFACMWNHRDLKDPLQSEIEAIFRYYIGEFNYGIRREDQTNFLQNSEQFSKIFSGYFPFTVTISAENFYSAWESHGTLAKEMQEKRSVVLGEIKSLLATKPKTLQIPYATRIWVAQMK